MPSAPELPGHVRVGLDRLAPSLFEYLPLGIVVSDSRGELIEAKHRSRAFDGMQSAKYAAHQFHIAAALVQLKQRGFKFDNNLASLFSKE